MVYQRTAGPGLMVALNNDIWNPNWTTVTCRSDHTTGTVLKDYTARTARSARSSPMGRSPSASRPPATAQGYGCWAPEGIEGMPTLPARSTTQVLYGAEDLDIGPAVTGLLTISPRLWVAAHTRLTLTLEPTTTGWEAGASLVLNVLDPQGAGLGALTWAPAGAARQTLEVTPTASGWHTLTLTGTALPPAPAGSPFAITATYTAPKGI